MGHQAGEEVTFQEILGQKIKDVRSYSKYDENNYNHKNNIIRLALIFENRGYSF